MPLPGLIGFLENSFGTLRRISQPHEDHAALIEPTTRLRAACVTNACRLNASFMIDCLGLSHFFDTLVLGDECALGKPHPDPYLEALKRCEATPDSVVVFEDSKTGIQSARAAGIRLVIGIASTQPHQRLIDAGAYAAVDNFSEVTLEWLQQLNSQIYSTTLE